MPYSLSEFIVASHETVIMMCTAVFGPQDALPSLPSLSMVTGAQIAGLPYRVGHADSSLSKESLCLVKLAINRMWADSTRSLYRSRLLQFLRFCDSKGIDSHQCLPASELLLCGFAASTIGLRGASTARGNLAAVRAWHIEEGVLYMGSSSMQLLCVLCGVENSHPAASF
jgi:hypothetical protein